MFLYVQLLEGERERECYGEAFACDVCMCVCVRMWKR